MTLTLTYYLDLQFLASCGHTYSHAKVQGQRSIGSEDRVETNGRTDGPTDVQTDGGDRITPTLMRSVKMTSDSDSGGFKFIGVVERMHAR